LGTADNDLYIASFEAYNRWLADFCKYDSKRLSAWPTCHAGHRPIHRHAQGRRGARLKGVNIPAFRSPLRNRRRRLRGQVLALSGDPEGRCSTTIRNSTASGRPASTTTWPSPFTSAPGLRGPA